jgi:hypothetical protein
LQFFHFSPNDRCLRSPCTGQSGTERALGRGRVF